MQIRTDGKLNVIKVDPLSTVLVEFCPDGVNEPLSGGRTTGFTIGTLLTPDGSMSLSITLPKENIYKMPSEKAFVIVLSDLGGYEKLAFKSGDDIDSIIELEKI